jgi:phenylalanine-4-hydroxylase
MAYVTGGVRGLEKTKKAKSVNTVELDSGLQISGKLKEYHKGSSEEVIYLQFEGPCQISYKNKQLKDHGKNYHQQGYGSPLGKYTTQKLGKVTRLNFDSGVIVEGELVSQFKKDKKTLLLSFKKCTVTYGSQVFFEPAWGIYDMAIGLKVTSVFGGPADKVAYGELESFVAHRVQKINLSKEKKALDKLYAEVRLLRNKFKKTAPQIEKLKSILNSIENLKTEWLLRLEILELLWPIEKEKELCQKLLQFFSELNVPSDLKETIQNGVKNITKISNPANTRNSFFAKAIHSTLL